MNRLFIALVLFSVILVPVLAVKGVDVSQPFDTSVYQCMKNNGMAFVIIRGYCSYGGVDSHAVAGLQAAKAAGLITDVYFFPCTGKKSPATQAAEMFEAIPANLFGMVWIDVETNPSPGCGWEQHSAAENCQFLI
jgi:GH25 family lysozyme M1 (1,4-beta-N-acetylmuramidase)